MAINLSKTSCIRVLGRCYSSQVAPIGGVANYDITNTKAGNLLVTSADNQSPIKRVSVVIRAGARFETPEEAGITHLIRICAGLTTQNISQFAISRQIQQVGASLHCTTDRETISYTLEGTECSVQKVLPILAEVVTKQVFHPWELSDVLGRVKLELATRPPALRAVDLLHKAAYGYGLGNSLFIPKYNIGKICSETLQHYVQNNFVEKNTAIVGLGIDQTELEDFAKTLELSSQPEKLTPSKYLGGQIRSDKGGNLAYVAIAGEGGKLTDAKKAVAFAVLQRILGCGSKIKYSTTDNGLLKKAIPNSSEIAISALNATYGDSGLFGAIFIAPTTEAGAVTEAVVKVLKEARITDADLTRGKNQLLASVLLACESGRSAVRKLGTSAVITKGAISPATYAASINDVTLEDVKSALKSVTANQLSIAAFGNLRCVPYLRNL